MDKSARRSTQKRSKRPDLESVLIEFFQNGNITNISQTTASLQQSPEWRQLMSQDVRSAIFKLEKAGILVREKSGGVTRFRYAGGAAAVSKFGFDESFISESGLDIQIKDSEAKHPTVLMRIDGQAYSLTNKDVNTVIAMLQNAQLAARLNT